MKTYHNHLGLVVSLPIIAVWFFGACSDDRNGGSPEPPASPPSEDLGLISQQCDDMRHRILAEENINSLEDLLELLDRKPADFWKTLTCDEIQY